MSDCEHRVFNIKPRLVEGDGVTTEIMILSCEKCNSIIDYFDPALFNGEALELAGIRKQFKPRPEHYENHILRQQVAALQRDIEKYKKEIEKSNDYIEKMMQNEKNELKKRYWGKKP